MRGCGTPRFGFGTSTLGRACRLGYAVGALGTDAVIFALDVDARREGRPMHGGVSQGLAEQAAFRS